MSGDVKQHLVPPASDTNFVRSQSVFKIIKFLTKLIIYDNISHYTLSMVLHSLSKFKLVVNYSEF